MFWRQQFAPPDRFQLMMDGRPADAGTPSSMGHRPEPRARPARLSCHTKPERCARRDEQPAGAAPSTFRSDACGSVSPSQQLSTNDTPRRGDDQCRDRVAGHHEERTVIRAVVAAMPPAAKPATTPAKAGLDGAPWRNSGLRMAVCPCRTLPVDDVSDSNDSIIQSSADYKPWKRFPRNRQGSSL